MKLAISIITIVFLASAAALVSVHEEPRPAAADGEVLTPALVAAQDRNYPLQRY